ncbi:hypothetical protein ACIF8W_37215 [Streptomyces sp. NPDC085639]|uniref:hypothetical protein n=1 Tax=Streptomyces sp. NPDC085639 TaxID=3365734 RepID=UPI0037CDD1B6
MGEGRRETWTTEEFGSSHTGAVGVLLADGTVPDPAYFDSGSGPGGQAVSQWSVYDGRWAHVPRAAALRTVCSCGWAGPEHRLDWEVMEGQGLDLDDGGEDQADACLKDWDGHTEQVEATTIPLPETVTTLLERLEEEIDKLTRTSPVAAVRAARRLEVTAERGRLLDGPRHRQRPRHRTGRRRSRAQRGRCAEVDGPPRPLEPIPLTPPQAAGVTPARVYVVDR